RRIVEILPKFGDKRQAVNIAQQIQEDTSSYLLTITAMNTLVGEMRDLDTIEMALTAAETGHMVLSTLHTVGAVETVDRIINIFPGHRQEEIRSVLSLSLNGLISQILLPGRKKNERVMVYELMILNSAMRNMIREKKTNQLKSALMLARKDGCVTLKDNLGEAIRDERVDPKLLQTLIKEIVE
ncbi:MAG: Flp pilus assembly complex ATPase component TadA, partial [Candidatus Riflebacteria bacterium]|nr:Flp pilus assembly complex ATPase component TadA [Candidatus Riflebacteria bacterium]